MIYRAAISLIVALIIGVCAVLSAQTPVSAQEAVPRPWTTEEVTNFESMLSENDPVNTARRYPSTAAAKTSQIGGLTKYAKPALKTVGRVAGPLSWVLTFYMLLDGNQEPCENQVDLSGNCVFGMPVDSTGEGTTSGSVSYNSAFDNTDNYTARGQLFIDPADQGYIAYSGEHFGNDNYGGGSQFPGPGRIWIGETPPRYVRDGMYPPGSKGGVTTGRYKRFGDVNPTTGPWKIWAGETFNSSGDYATAWREVGILYPEASTEAQPATITNIGPSQAAPTNPEPGHEIPSNDSKLLYDYLRDQPEYQPYPADAAEQEKRWGKPVRSWQNEDGSTSTEFTDGTVVTRYQDGTIYIKYPDGSTEWVRATDPGTGPQTNPKTIAFPQPAPGKDGAPYAKPSPYPGQQAVPNPPPEPFPAPQPLPPSSEGSTCPIPYQATFELPEMRLGSVFPFSLVLWLWDALGDLSGPPVAPSFDLGGFGTITVPAAANGAVSVVRNTISFAVACGMMLLFYRLITGKGGD
jgi:hypothetical protein